MDSSQLNAVISVINAYKRISPTGIFPNAYGINNEQEIDKIRIGPFEVEEMLMTLDKALKLLEQELKNNWKFLPFQPEKDRPSLVQNLEHIVSNIETGNRFEYWIEQLIWLVQYEMSNGFWSKANDLTGSEFYTLYNTAEELTARLRATISEADKLREQLRIQYRDNEKLNANNAVLRRELDGVLEATNNALSHMQESDALSNSTSAKAAGLIESLEARWKEASRSVEHGRNNLANYARTVNKIERGLNASIELFRNTESEFQEVLTNAKEKESRLLEHEKTIKRIQSTLADDALSDVFTQRHEKLSSTVMVWACSSAASALIALAWAFIVFYKYDTSLPGGINWLLLLGNIARTSPAFVMLYFCLTQYTKERNLQEEYAFKAAVSKTVTAYSDMVDGEEKTKMLISTVQGVYTPPVLGKPFKPISLRSKHFVEASRSAAEAIKDVKDIVDAVKENKPSKKEDKKAASKKKSDEE